jgi:dipeptidyl aminopeptidase/acylaminoacyl peptidase
MVTDQDNDAVWNVYRFDVATKQFTKVSNLVYTMGYGFESPTGALLVTGQATKDGPACVYRIDGADPQGAKTLACTTAAMSLSAFNYPVSDAEGGRIAVSLQKDSQDGQKNLGILRAQSGTIDVVTDPSIARSRVFPLMWDGDQLYFVTNEETGEPGGLYVYDDASHKITLVRHNTAIYGADDDAEFGDPKSRRVVLNDKVNDRESLVVFDLQTKKDIFRVDNIPFHYAYITDLLSPAADGSYLAAVDSVGTPQPSRFLERINPAATSNDKVLSVGFDPRENRALSSACQSEIIEYPTFDTEADGTTRMIKAILHHPAIVPDRPAAVVWLHGGPTEESTQQFDEKRELLCHLGYTVLAPNVRGSSGRGVAFEDLNNGDWGGGDYLDVEYGRQYLKMLGIDESRIGVAGHSYGGFLTNAAMTKAGDRFAFGIASAGLSDLLIEFSDGNIPDMMTSEMGDPTKDPAIKQKYIDHSPVTHAENLHVPYLMMHGTTDQNVPFAQAQELYDKLQALNKGALVTFVKLEGIGHYFLEVGVHVRTYQAMMDLLYQVAPVRPVSQP